MSSPAAAYHVPAALLQTCIWLECARGGFWLRVSNRPGGDWGSAITTVLGALHSDHCKAIHINGCFAPPSLLNPWHLAQLVNASLPIANRFPLFISFQEMGWLKAFGDFQAKETGALL